VHRFLEADLKSRRTQPSVTVRILHVFRIFCSRSISVSFVARRITDSVSPFLGKGRQPVLVRACCGLVSKRSGRGGLLPPTRSFDSDIDAMGAPSAERGGSAQAYGRSSEIAPENAGTAAEERAAEAAQVASAKSLQRAYGQRSDCASRVPEHACGGDELERHGARRICRSARSFAACVALMARSPGRIRQRNGLAIPASSECPGSIKQRC
jgi:hypothetical protein